MDAVKRRWLIATAVGGLATALLALTGKVLIGFGFDLGDLNEVAEGLLDKIPLLSVPLVFISKRVTDIYPTWAAAKASVSVWLLLTGVSYKSVSERIDRRLFKPFSESPHRPVQRPASATFNFGRLREREPALPWSMVPKTARRTIWADVMTLLVSDLIQTPVGERRARPLAFSWCILTGPPGYGKTRLVHEIARNLARRDLANRRRHLLHAEEWGAWMREHFPTLRRRAAINAADLWEGDPWDAGIVDASALESDMDAFRRWVPRRPTLLILDDPAPAMAQRVVGMLGSRRRPFPKPVRLIVVAQTIPPDLGLRRENQEWVAPVQSAASYRGVVRLSPAARFGEAEVRMLTTHVRALYPTAAVRELLSVTEGNPLLVELAIKRVQEGALLKDLRQSDLLRDEGRKLRGAMAEIGLGDTTRQAALGVAHLCRGANREVVEKVGLLPDISVLALVYGHSGSDLHIFIPEMVPQLIGDAFVDDLLINNSDNLARLMVGAAWIGNQAGLASTIARREDPPPVLLQAFQQTVIDRFADRFLLGVFEAATRHRHAETLCREAIRADPERVHRLFGDLVAVAVADGAVPERTLQAVLDLLQTVRQTGPSRGDEASVVDLLLHLEMPTESQVVSWLPTARLEAATTFADAVNWSHESLCEDEDRLVRLASHLQQMPAGLGGIALMKLHALLVRVNKNKVPLTAGRNEKPLEDLELKVLAWASEAFSQAPAGEGAQHIEKIVEVLDLIGKIEWRSRTALKTLEDALSNLAYAYYVKPEEGSDQGCKNAAERCLEVSRELGPESRLVYVVASFRYLADKFRAKDDYEQALCAAKSADEVFNRAGCNDLLLSETAWAWAIVAQATSALPPTRRYTAAQEIAEKVLAMTLGKEDDLAVLSRIVSVRASLIASLFSAKPDHWHVTVVELVERTETIVLIHENEHLDLALCEFYSAYANVIAADQRWTAQDSVTLGEKASAIAAPYFDNRRIRNAESFTWQAVLDCYFYYQPGSVSEAFDAATSRIDDVCARFPGDPWFEAQIASRVRKEIVLFGLTRGHQRVIDGLLRIKAINFGALSRRERVRIANDVKIIRNYLQSNRQAIVIDHNVAGTLDGLLDSCGQIFDPSLQEAAFEASLA